MRRVHCPVARTRICCGGELYLLSAFCWTKFGTESGESSSSIRARKESERHQNGGVFLWGVGNSIRPSLLALLQLSSDPEIVFTPMLSRAASADVAPDSLVLWRGAVGIDGAKYDLPLHSLVTSRCPRGGRVRAHYALVCQREAALDIERDTGSIDSSEIRNLRTGAIVGPSQVTAVVQRTPREAAGGRLYQVAFRASLVYPYFVKLSAPLAIPDDLRLDRLQGREREGATRELLAMRASLPRSASPTGCSFNI